MELNKAINRARGLARANDRIYYVILEAGEFEVADAYDLDTFFAGTRESDVQCACAPDGRNTWPQ